MSDYDDYSIHKWDNYPVMKKKTPREEWIHKVYNDTYRARTLLRESLDVLPVEVFDDGMVQGYGVLEVLLTEALNKWKDKE